MYILLKEVWRQIKKPFRDPSKFIATFCCIWDRRFIDLADDFAFSFSFFSALTLVSTFFSNFFYFRYSTLRTFFLDLSFPFTTWELTAHNTSSSNHKMLFLFRIFRSPKLWSSCFIRWRFDRDGYWCANTFPFAVFNDDFLENRSECWKSLARFRTPSTADFHCAVYYSR